ncbi:hypothetical protein [Actinomadura rupiterrae]|uniref:hypothetical protein n=1 Tax=Actinomadura rupiterrae TaxID=559627 RepID=UPI0020A531D3|nr:hypothetical protein [Actinomadura rupiterrae]MCP2340410.1 hypothetical protein [Actinomadura rupiterrae]
MADPRERLERLGAALMAEGLSTRLAMDDPPLLHVKFLGPPVAQETIGCGERDGQLWFRWVSQEVLLGRADDVPGAAERVRYVLMPPGISEPDAESEGRR